MMTSIIQPDAKTLVNDGLGRVVSIPTSHYRDLLVLWRQIMASQFTPPMVKDAWLRGSCDENRFSEKQCARPQRHLWLGLVHGYLAALPPSAASEDEVIEVSSVTAGRLRGRLQELRWTQKMLAKKIGVTQGAISQIATGRTRDSRHLVKIADQLAVSVKWLAGLDLESVEP